MLLWLLHEPMLLPADHLGISSVGLSSSSKTAISSRQQDREIGQPASLYSHLPEATNCKEPCRKCIPKKIGVHMAKEGGADGYWEASSLFHSALLNSFHFLEHQWDQFLSSILDLLRARCN